jgi:glycogen(starch) synthase
MIDADLAPPGALLLEISTEVCNQVGGIYQVLRSKAATMSARWGDHYVLVGPYEQKRAEVEFEVRVPSGWMKQVVELLASQGLTVHYGRWLIPGNPRCLLVEHQMSTHDLDAVKYRLWNDHKIECPAGDGTIDLAVSFGDAVRRVLGAVCHVSTTHKNPEKRKVLAHFHEWLGGLAIPMARRDRMPVTTVFTTHATLLGRYIASNEENFYDTLGGPGRPGRNAEFEAGKYNIKCQHAMERACAHGAHVFTTVSPITGEECAALLGRPVDMVLPNGLDVARHDVGHEFQTLHAQFKEKINRFVMGHFFPSYQMDLDRTIYMFTSGRFEPRNKGFDLCLEALARLNAQIKAFGIPVNVVFFIITARPVRFILPDVLQSSAVLDELRSVCSSIMRDVGAKLFPRAAAGEKVNIDTLVDPYWSVRYRRTQQALRRSGLPPIVTHAIENEGADAVLNYMRSLHLFNKPDDPVKVVYHPQFITSTNPLWGIEYEQFVRGCHLGVFPSAYEPWGYTPLECAALGVPAVTSDLAGFGRYIAEKYPDHDDWGLNVLKRRGRGYHEAAADLARWLLAYCRLDRKGRIDLRNRVQRQSELFDWTRLGRAYHRAHDLALERAAADA